MSGSSGQYKPELPITRYIFSRRHFGTNPLRVKHEAFQPNLKGERVETSIFRTDDLTEQEIWELGDREVASARGMQILARGDLKLSHVDEAGLDYDFNEEPKRHGAIIGWALEKNERKIQAMELAELASLEIYE